LAVDDDDDDDAKENPSKKRRKKKRCRSLRREAAVTMDQDQVQVLMVDLEVLMVETAQMVEAPQLLRILSLWSS
jgi:hypothetical protein